MPFREALRDWLPPPLLRAIRRARAPKGPPEWEYLPGGWPAAPPDTGGWNAGSVVETQQRTWPEFARLVRSTGPLGINHTDLVPTALSLGAHNTVMAFAYVLALAAHGKEALSFLDWGGGLGHYGELSRALLPGTRVEYFCRDLPRLCAGGREALPDATFVETDEECAGRRYDLVAASSSLQYSRHWEATLGFLAGLAGGYLYVTRLPVVEQAPSFVVLQRPHACGYRTEYAGWFLNRGAFLAAAGASGLELIREFLIDERPPVPGSPEEAECRGFLFRRP